MIRRVLARIPLVETAIFVVAVGLLVAIAANRQEPVALFDTYSSYDAHGGGYRALYELAERERLGVARFERRAAFLDASVATLVYAEPLPFDPAQADATPGDARAIEAWVRAGGALVYLGHDDAAAKAKLLALPFTRSAAKRPHAALISPSLRNAGVRALGNVSTSLRWKLATTHARTLFDDGRGAVAIAYPFGRGSVTAIVDEQLLDNANLASADRARFAVALLAPARGTIWFDEAAHGYLVPEHWWSIVPRPFVIATIVATIVLAIACIGAAVRFGPAVVPPRSDDRTSADFIDALATLLERGKAPEKALSDAVRSTSRTLARSLGLSDDPPPDQIAARLGDQERRADFETMLALANEPKPTTHAFVRALALAQRLRKDAVTHGR